MDTLLAPSGAAPTGSDTENAAKMAMRAALAAGPLAKQWSNIEHLVVKNGTGWAVGSSLTVADLAIYVRMGSFLAGKYDGIPAAVLDPMSALRSLFHKVEANEKVAAWNAAH